MYPMNGDHRMPHYPHMDMHVQHYTHYHWQKYMHHKMHVECYAIKHRHHMMMADYHHKMYMHYCGKGPMPHLPSMHDNMMVPDWVNGDMMNFEGIPRESMSDMVPMESEKPKSDN